MKIKTIQKSKYQSDVFELEREPVFAIAHCHKSILFSPLYYVWRIIDELH